MPGPVVASSASQPATRLWVVPRAMPRITSPAPPVSCSLDSGRVSLLIVSDHRIGLISSHFLRFLYVRDFRVAHVPSTRGLGSVHFRISTEFSRVSAHSERNENLDSLPGTERSYCDHLSGLHVHLFWSFVVEFVMSETICSHTLPCCSSFACAPLDSFPRRHICPREHEIPAMLNAVGYDSLDGHIEA